jgi:hypothetical protein
MKNLTLTEFLKLLSTADGGTAIELVSKFQAGAILIEGLGAEDFEDE